MDGVNITTNHQPRHLISWYELTDEEKREFDYYKESEIESGEVMPEFFRYKGELYDAGEFSPMPGPSKWDGYLAQAFYFGVIVKFVPDDPDSIIVGRYCT